MKLTCERDAALKAISRAHGAISKSQVPILGNLLLEADADGLTVTGTNLDQQISERISARVEEVGRITLPANALFDIARNTPAGSELAISTTGEGWRAAIQCGRSRFQLPTLPADDFALLTDDDLPEGGLLPADTLKRALEKVRFAMSTEESRPILNGAYLHAAEVDGGAAFTFVGTDGHRLASYTLASEARILSTGGVIIPRDTVDDLIKLLGDAGKGAEVRLRASPVKMQVSLDGWVLTSRMLDGDYPDYVRVIPRGNERPIRFDAQLLDGLIKRLTIVATDKARRVLMLAGPGRAAFSAKNVASGELDEEMDVEFEGEPFELALNAKYVAEQVARIDGEWIDMNFGPNRGAPILVTDSADARALYVLMPQVLEGQS